MNDLEKEKIYEMYCGNNMNKLRKICNEYFFKFGRLYQMDYDDFLSKANETVWYAVKNYNPDMGTPFDLFLKTCIKKKFNTEIRNRNRKKRSNTKIVINENGEKQCIFNSDVSLNGSDDMFLNSLSSNVDLFDEIFSDDILNNSNDRIEKFYNNIRKKSRPIAELIIKGYKPKEIINILNITQADYNKAIKEFKMFDNVMILKHK